MPLSPTEIDTFLAGYGDSLAAYDARKSSLLWGTPGLILSDEFAGTLTSRDEMTEGLEQSYPLYRKLGLDRVTHTVLDRVDLTTLITRVRVRWHFFSGDEHLTDGDFEYLIRQDDDGPHVYVSVAIDEAQKMADLLNRKGITPPEAGA